MQKQDDTAPVGRKPILETNSAEAQIVADNLEDGMSQKVVWTLVNLHRRDSGESSVTFSAVNGLISRLKPVVKKLKILKQGSNDPESPWARARFLWVRQLAVAFGLIKLKPDDFNDNILPDYFNPEKIRTYKLTQVLWVDESHKKAQPASDNNAAAVAGTRREILSFPRDQNGKLDLERGVYSKDVPSKMKCKYTEETRMCFGVAKVEPIGPNGERLPIEGRRMAPFDYSGKQLVSIKDWKNKIKHEIQRVKCLPKGGSDWIRKGGDPEAIYQNDDLTELKDCGKKRARDLKKNGIETVGQMRDQSDSDLLQISQKTKEQGCVSLNVLRGFREQAKQSRNEDRPETVDFRTKVNPYEARYGENWEEKIKKSRFVSQYVCITEMIEHVEREGNRIFADTEFALDWAHYHDALSLLTAKDTMEWMQQKDYLKRWIRPQLGLMEDKEGLARYHGRPVGDSPEMMPLDHSLIQDTNMSVERHIAVTSHLDNDDPRKFSISTPKRGASAYRRVVDPVDGVAPTSKRIIQDIDGVFNAIKEIIRVKGIVVKDSDVRNGHRGEAARLGRGRSANWGGQRERKLAPDEYVCHPYHKDAEEQLRVKIEASTEKVGAARQQDPTNDEPPGAT